MMNRKLTWPKRPNFTRHDEAEEGYAHTLVTKGGQAPYHTCHKGGLDAFDTLVTKGKYAF